MSDLGFAPYVSPTTAAGIKTAFARLFATSMLLGTAGDITLWRGDDAVPAQRVLVVMARREAADVRGAAAFTTEADGEFRKSGPFDVIEGDRFTFVDAVSGRGFAGRIESVYPSSGAYTRATFILES